MSDEFKIGVKGLPLKIDTVSVPSLPGLIGISACPGMKEFSTLDLYDDRIENDLQCIVNWGARAIVTVLDLNEIATLGVTALPARIVARDIVWLHLPMSNNLVPEEKFEEKWRLNRDRLLQFLQQGEKVLIHCKEGIGRSALVAARLLIESGIDAGRAISAVRKARPGCLALHSQQKYCYSLAAAHVSAKTV